MTAKIREFKSTDYPAVIELWKRVDLTLKDVDTLPSLERFIAVHPGLFLVGDLDGYVLGTVIGAWDGRRGWIYHLAVQPDHQGIGVARRLMEKIENNLRTLGATQVNILVEPENLKAMGFYKKIGYQGHSRELFQKKLSAG